ncbi:DNA-formamidopyrimidine glycosylase family protein [[Flexibacter] sp. ATCC 35103]|uniref:DNA-formamidopyrimidine glycosylase family protein n=1 Tax=[Flexibacter] sp. ATCC 35103 TaxID=1937528 RepID=UPI0009C4BBFA|nr:DNA-formamidopyrimidine glycosylase family protein [[Flexibacter] sp. ATCC 35103]OMQ13169.1 endonuclease [[Flexibacter] sp. ATCC 35103]
MPEGPSILILKEEVQQFEGQKVIAASGNSAIDIPRLKNKTIREFKTWGKHFLICFDGFTVKIHLLMFGTYRINERKETKPRLSMVFSNGELNFYTCSVKILEGDINDYYKWNEDVMSEMWDPKKAKDSLDKTPNEMICDAILDQNIFSGVGNIIKNEVLYRCRIHPESLIGKIPSEKLYELISECSIYSFEFLYWKKKFELKQHWLAYSKTTCLRCNLPIYKKNTGKRNRSSFFCTNCQKLHI